jgi:hypothetical protein
LFWDHFLVWIPIERENIVVKKFLQLLFLA